MNDERVEWVRQAIDGVDAFKESLEDGGPYQAVKDMLCDIMHYCHAEGLNFDEIVDAAGYLFRGEVADDE